LHGSVVCQFELFDIPAAEPFVESTSHCSIYDLEGPNGEVADMKMRSDTREIDKIYKRRDRYEIPDWQREEVWDLPRKQLLIDTILRGWRLPKFYFVLASPQTYEVVDGQQRLATIFEFLSKPRFLSGKRAIG
jgi:Protein of unknown function DUF262